LHAAPLRKLRKLFPRIVRYNVRRTKRAQRSIDNKRVRSPILRSNRNNTVVQVDTPAARRDALHQKVVELIFTTWQREQSAR
jgi:hypothetical protein